MSANCTHSLPSNMTTVCLFWANSNCFNANDSFLVYLFAALKHLLRFCFVKKELCVVLILRVCTSLIKVQGLQGPTLRLIRDCHKCWLINSGCWFRLVYSISPCWCFHTDLVPDYWIWKTKVCTRRGQVEAQNSRWAKINTDSWYSKFSQ